jgi:hypothetical protein
MSFTSAQVSSVASAPAAFAPSATAPAMASVLPVPLQKITATLLMRKPSFLFVVYSNPLRGFE